MADKTTTLKTKTNDNVYPNVIGDNRKIAFVDSSTITHHFYDQTHKVGFQIANETNIKIQNSLQKPKGLTELVLVGVGKYGQEIIRIGDNLKLNGSKLSATVKIYSHFITLTNDTSTFYFTYQNTSFVQLNTLDSLKTALAGKYLLCTGHTDSETAEYISGERENIVVGVVDKSDNSTSGITIDSSFTITDDVKPVN